MERSGIAVRGSVLLADSCFELLLSVFTDIIPMLVSQSPFE
jgi:hypothetical protein